MPYYNLRTVRIIIFIPSIFQRRKMFKSTHFCRAFETWHKDVLVDILSKGDPCILAYIFDVKVILVGVFSVSSHVIFVAPVEISGYA